MTFVHSDCAATIHSAPKITWNVCAMVHALASSWFELPVPFLGEWLATVLVHRKLQCPELCDATPGCQSISLKQMNGNLSLREDEYQCVLQALCLKNSSRGPDWARYRYGMAGRRAAWREAVGFVTYGRRACTNESRSPAASVHRRRPRAVPSGLLSLDCALNHGRTRPEGWRKRLGRTYGREAHGYCSWI